MGNDLGNDLGTVTNGMKPSITSRKLIYCKEL